MNRDAFIALIAIVISLTIGAALACAGGYGGYTPGNWPLFSLLTGGVFLIQFLAWIPAAVYQTEKYYDLTGSVTYILAVQLGLLLTPGAGVRSMLLAVMVLVWALRLGTHLYMRIHRAGHDSRFVNLRQSPLRFLMAWTMQGLWISVTAGAALAAITSGIQDGIDSFAVAGSLVWLLGFAIETIADRQKNAFRANPANSGRFIQSGLWARSRHPNYFGEILLWIGVALAAAPALQYWQWATLISPLFVILLLTKVSGIPLLEKQADERWGGQPDYEAYKASTPLLLPRLGR